MFAIAIWDTTRRKLVLARDRLGVKPLYYLHHNETLYFSSELKALTKAIPFDRSLNESAIQHYLSFRHVGSTDSIFSSASKVPPAHLLVVEAGRATLVPYWTPIPRNEAPAHRSETRAVISAAVARRLKAEVPLSVALSGGLDSSIVLFEATNLLGAAPPSFSVRYPNMAEDESDVAVRFAERLGSAHHTIDFPEIDTSILPSLAYELDEPFGDYSALPSHILFKEQKKYSTVVLTGDGGDEAFGGYTRYRQAINLDHLSRLVPKGLVARFCSLKPRVGSARLNRVADYLRSSRAERYSKILSLETDAEILGLLGADLRERAMSRASNCDHELYDDLSGVKSFESIMDYFQYLPGDVLAKVDRTSMASSIEARSPFLDYLVVEHGISLGSRFRATSRLTKRHLRQVYRTLLPSEIVSGRKRGFTVPRQYMLHKSYRDFAHDVLLSSACSARGILSAEGIATLLHDVFISRRRSPTVVWNVVMLELWCRAFLDPRS
jgi:asparagine synthase (glutamine-hydrolysing)